MTTLKSLFDAEKEQFLQDYRTFLRFQSISTDPKYASDVKKCGEWVVEYLKKIGFHVEVWPTSGYPTIFASYLKAGPNKPTVLMYNHYDVQPVDPLELWESPPFEPTERNGQIYARGAQDNKGQCIYTLQAMKLLLQRDGNLPVNVKLVIEGEEESGSAGIAGILQAKKEELKADYLTIVDMGIPSLDRPAVTLGVRGLITMDVEAEGSCGDLHSGSHGGVVFNPIHALIDIFASLRDKDGKITLSGFYDDVVPLTEEEKKTLSLHFDEEEYRKMFGTEATGGEKGYSPNERAWLRPTLEINGIEGGYSGKGFKTVIPAKASAKVSCRLVPNQDPKEIARLISNEMIKKAPPGIKISVHAHPGQGKAIRASASSKIVKAFSEAYEEIFGKPCERIFGGGTIPVVSELGAASGADVVLLGLALPDDQIHAPNEHFGIDRLEKGCYIVARALENLAK